MSDNATHDLVVAHLAEFLAGGLSPEEMDRASAHLKTCPTCQHALGETREMETKMNAALGTLSPGAGFEDRLIAGLRLSDGRRWDLLRRAATITAAALVIGGLGHFGSEAMERGKLPWALPGMGREHNESLSATAGTTLYFSQHQWRSEADASTHFRYADGAKPNMDVFYKTTGLPASSAPGSPRDANDSVLLPAEDSKTSLTNSSVATAAQKQVANYNFDASVQAARDAIRRGDVAGGKSALQAARAARNTNPNAFTPAENSRLDSEITQVQSNIEVASANKALTDRLSAHQPAGDDTLARARSASEERERTVSALTQRSQTLLAEGRRKDALNVIDQIKTIDPANVYARFALPSAAGQPPQSGDAGFKDSDGDGMADKGLSAGNPAIAASGETAPTPIDRKIVRTGTVVFEVESFDVASMRVGELVAKARGFVSSANSEKLPNGKVHGAIVIRVPPEQLDGVLAQLRLVGEVRSQNIQSEDVTRHFVDTEGQLRAARAVESRLLDIIKNGKGEVKDLVAAEKELGEWRTKIESLEGELRYVSNQVAYSTVTLSLAEKDIKAAATAVQTEEVNAAVEAADVSRARAALVEFVGASGGRVVESEVRQLDGGQTVGRVVADVPQAKSGELAAKVKALGDVSKFEVQRRETLAGESAGAAPKVEQRMTRLTLDLFSPEAMLPRLTQQVELATDDVRPTYDALLARAKADGARVLSSELKTEAAPFDAEATISVSMPSDKAEALVAGLPDAGQVLRLQGSETPAGPNVTQAKRVVTVHVVPATHIVPRERRALSVQAADLLTATRKVTDAARAAGAHVQESGGTTSGGGGQQRLVVDLPSPAAAGLAQSFRDAGTVTEESGTLDPAGYAGPHARTRIELTLSSPPRLVSEDQGLSAAFRSAMSTSLLGLLWSLRLVVVGVCLVLPWAALAWITHRLWRSRRAKTPRVSDAG